MGGLQPMPSLVFSNACQSGHSGEWRIGEEDEQRIFGLANAYLLSGVQHYIGTFWEILDEPSSQFAKLFTALSVEGESVGEAVRKREKSSLKPTEKRLSFGPATCFMAIRPLHSTPPKRKKK